jgi:hypothetical protein
MVDTLPEILAMQTGEVARVERINCSSMLGSKRELIRIFGATSVRFDGGQDVDSPSAEPVHHSVLAGIFIHKKTDCTHGASSG